VGASLVVALYQEARSNACTTCVLGNIDAGWGPVDVTYDNASGHLYVLDGGPGLTGSSAWGVSVINGSTDTVVAFYHLPNRPAYLTYDSRNGDLYISMFCSDEVLVLNASTGAIAATIPTSTTGLCEGPGPIAYNPNTGSIELEYSTPNVLLTINGNVITQSVPLSVNTQVPPAVNPVTGQVYVVTAGKYLFNSFNLTTVNGSTGAVESSIFLWGNPSTLMFDPTKDRVYAGATVEGFVQGTVVWNGTVYLVSGNGTTVLGQPRVGETPTRIAVDSANGNIYVSNYYASNLSVINGSIGEIAGSVPVDSNPASVVFDGRNRCLYTLFYAQAGTNGAQSDGYVSVVEPPGGDCVAPPTPLSALLATIAGPTALVALAVVVLVLWARRVRRGPRP